MKIKTLCSFLLMAVMACSFLAGCGSESDTAVGHELKNNQYVDPPPKTCSNPSNPDCDGH
jgi:ABC-type uncharacterized transport system auxiliary subunit